MINDFNCQVAVDVGDNVGERSRMSVGYRCRRESKFFFVVLTKRLKLFFFFTLNLGVGFCFLILIFLLVLNDPESNMDEGLLITILIVSIPILFVQQFILSPTTRNEKEEEKGKNRRRRRSERVATAAVGKTENPSYFLNQIDWIKLLVYFSVGTLLTDICLHLIPESFDKKDKNSNSIFESISLLTGICLFLFLDKLSIFYSSSDQELKKTSDSTGRWVALFGNSLHCFSDGLTLAIAFNGSQENQNKTGYATAISIASHELSHKISEAAVLSYKHLDEGSILQSSTIQAAFTIAGYFFGNFFSETKKQQTTDEQSLLKTHLMAPFITGLMIYNCFIHIIAELVLQTDHKNTSDKTRRKNKTLEFLLEISAFIFGVLLIANL